MIGRAGETVFAQRVVRICKCVWKSCGSNFGGQKTSGSLARHRGPTAHARARYRCFLPDLAGLAGVRCVGPMPDLNHFSKTHAAAARCEAVVFGISGWIRGRMPVDRRRPTPGFLEVPDYPASHEIIMLASLACIGEWQVRSARPKISCRDSESELTGTVLEGI
jgi:hypothetical protein